MVDWQIFCGENGENTIKVAGVEPIVVIIGKAGLISSKAKREGDMATPVGRWALRHLYYRKDRLGQISCALPMSEITPHCGWCDDPTHSEYNHHVTLPFSASHERMWREDGAYDLVVMLGFNDEPPVAGRGSAIFLHCIALGKTNTAGCIALPRMDLLNLIQHACANQFLRINARVLA